MARHSNSRDYLAFAPKSYSIPSQGSNNLYRKRLRSWKRSSSPSKSSISSSLIENKTISARKSTIYTFPIHRPTDQQSEFSNTIPSESVTSQSQSAFYASSIPHSSIRIIGEDLNNNNHFERKRKHLRSASNESLASHSLKSPSMESLQLICSFLVRFDHFSALFLFRSLCAGPRSPTKRSRLSLDHSAGSTVDTDPCTIDINQRDVEKSTSFSLDEKLPLNHSNAIANAVKMVQPIVDIIFNAFENQLKTNESSAISPVPYPIYSPLMMSYAPSRALARPITLHAVHFNIQLTNETPTKATLTDVSSSMPRLNSTSKDNSETNLSASDLSLKEGDDSTLNTGHRLKQMLQFALLGVSVLCGYWFL